MTYKKLPLVSVLMNCYNGEKYLYEAVNSIVNQTYKNWELVFIDNNSIDNSKKIILSFNDIRIKYLKLDKFLPLGEARKIGWDNCKGDYIAILDSDDYAYPNRLESQIIFFLKNIEFAVYGSCLNIIDKQGKFLEKVDCSTDPILLKEIINYSFPFMNSTLMINKIKGDNVGGLDPSYEIIHDHEFVFRISRKYKISNSDSVFSKWRKHDQNLSWKKMLKGQTELKNLLKKASKNIIKRDLFIINKRARSINSLKISYLSFLKFKIFNAIYFFMLSIFISPKIIIEKKIIKIIINKIFSIKLNK